MKTADEYAERAEKLADRAAANPSAVARDIQRAQVFATLAIAAATLEATEHVPGTTSPWSGPEPKC